MVLLSRMYVSLLYLLRGLTLHRVGVGSLVLALAAVAALLVRDATSGASPLEAEAVLPAHALSRFEPYLLRANGRNADPVNIVFLAPDTTAVNIAARTILRWPPVSASPMRFSEGPDVRNTAAQFQLVLGRGARYHLRIESVPRRDGRGYVLAAAHRDDPAACGHIGVEFDQARDLIADVFANAGYPVDLLWLGNTEAVRHCDGSLSAGDGRVAVINLRR